MIQKSIKLTVFALLVLVFSCEREYTNPWDEKANLSPSAWAPQNLQVEDISITEKKLTWTYDDENIEGFKLDRKKGDVAWQVAYQTFSKETRSWNDTEIVPDPSLTYSYRVYAYAGSNNSAEQNTSASAAITAPNNLLTEKLTDKSYKLTWVDNSIGEQGFMIDRKIDENNWAIAYGKVPENQTSFTDTNVFRATDVEYRVYAFYESYESSKVTTNTTAELTAPTNLQLEKLTDKSYNLTWTDNSTGEQGYKIDRRVDNGNWDKTYGEVLANQQSFIDTNVFRAKNIEYSVYAFSGDVESAAVIANTNAELTPPDDLQISHQSISLVTLNWRDNSTGEDGFKIERKYEGGNWEYLLTVTTDNYEDNNFELNTQVYYRVSAFVGTYNSSWAEKDFDATIPSPTNPQITNNSIISVTLNWQDNSTGEEGFKIERKYEGGNWEELAMVTTNNYEDDDFDLNTQVYYRVCAYVGTYNSSWAEKGFDATIPSPTNPQITNNSITSITLEWQDNSIGEDGFKVERKYEGGNWEELAMVTTNNYEDDDFDLNTQVYYRVCAYVGTYNSSWAEKGFDATIPSPTNPQITNNSITSVTLNWQDNSTGEDGFNIERKYEGGNWEELTSVTGNNYDDNNFNLNTQVYYRVCAYYSTYLSSWVETNFDATIPSPENLQITANSASSVTINWDYNLTGHNGFKIDRKINDGAWVVKIATLSAGQNSYDDEAVDLIENSYTYRIYAYLNAYESGKTEMTINKIEVGSIIFGGIVFYLDGNGGGLVCTESDQSTNAEWGCYGTTIGGTSTDIGTGAANTAAIVAGCSETGIAARICDELVLNGYSDWFLPSKDELDLMYENLKLNGIGGFADGNYWSSSESSFGTAWIQNFNNGYQNNHSKPNHYRVRAVQAF